MKPYENKNMTYKLKFSGYNKKLWLLITIACISMLMSACTAKTEEMDKTDENAVIIQEKSLLELSVDWCNFMRSWTCLIFTRIIAK